MQIRLLCIGKLREQYIRAAVDDYAKRLKPFHNLEEIELRPADGSDPQRAIAADSERILEHLAPSDRVWLLDRCGVQHSSEELAALFEAEELAGYSRMTFVIGGAYGFDPRIAARAQMRWSFSKLTFLHEWSRAICLEQIYRATKIRRGEPYHH